MKTLWITGASLLSLSLTGCGLLWSSTEHTHPVDAGAVQTGTPDDPLSLDTGTFSGIPYIGEGLAAGATLMAAATAAYAKRKASRPSRAQGQVDELQKRVDRLDDHEEPLG